MEINDPFFIPEDISASRVLDLINSYEFKEPIYHSDSVGHVQVEMPLQSDPFNINQLIKLIEHNKLWANCIKLISNKSDNWLLNFSYELQKESSAGVLNCLVHLTDFFNAPECKINHLQDAAQWPWESGSIYLFLKIKNRLIEVEKGLEIERNLSSELDLSIVRYSLQQLRLIEGTFKE